MYKDHPYVFRADGDIHEYTVAYVPGDMDSDQMGGNSNWRGPVWLPINFLLIESLREYHHYYGDDFQIECPTGSGQFANLDGVAHELAHRLGSLFVPHEGRPRPCHGSFAPYADDPTPRKGKVSRRLSHWKIVWTSNRGRAENCCDMSSFCRCMRT